MEQDASSVFPSQIPNSQSAILNQIVTCWLNSAINRAPITHQPISTAKHPVVARKTLHYRLKHKWGATSKWGSWLVG